MDPYARSAASDSAAHTASYIFYQVRNLGVPLLVSIADRFAEETG